MNTSEGRYVLCVVSLATLGILIFLAWATLGRDIPGAISGPLGPTWYEDLGGRAVTEIQDQDLFFHNIGSSIANARKADVIVVGSSLVSFAFNDDVLQAGLAKHGLTFYNMSFVGVSSGEFTRLIIEKYNLRPRLWIVNADDGGGTGSFFGKSLQRSFSADVRTISATEHDRIGAFAHVLRRNIRWQVEDLEQLMLNGTVFEHGGGGGETIPPFYRDAKTGAADFRLFPRYDQAGNPTTETRPRDCHASEDTIRIASEFVDGIGPVVLTLVPNTYYCEQQAREIGAAIGAELVLAGSTSYSTWDAGGHLDRKGSAAFSRDFLASLESSETFKAIVANH